MLMYNRFIEATIGDLVIGGSIEYNGGSIDEPIDIEFSTNMNLNRTPNEAEITLINLSPENQKDIQEEGLDVEIKAGYRNNQDEYLGLMFMGKTRRGSSVIENNTTVKTTIFAGDGDDSFKYAKANMTLPAGENDPLAVTEELAKILEGTGIEIGELRIEGPPDPRATVLDRPVRLELDDVCRRYNCHWTILDNTLYVWPKSEPIEPDPILLLTSETGLIGAPQPTETGVRIRTMMIHELKPGFTFELEATPSRGLDRQVDGIYRIESIRAGGRLLGGDKYGLDIVARLVEGEVKISRNVFADGGGQ